ncbi:MAG: NAD(P)-dependent oxidoreductase, partial [Candidatus Moranbacteria bacterium]|nr:NAD(P)-dependent oxidoreductase [Candidatus Moranbacteria bacterium]
MKIAFLGTGLMGYPIAERLLGRGHDVFVWNRTVAKCRGLAEKGGIVVN